MRQQLTLSQLQHAVSVIDSTSAFLEQRSDCKDRRDNLKKLLYKKLNLPSTSKSLSLGLVGWERMNIAWYADPNPCTFSIFTLDYEALFCGFHILLYMECYGKDVEGMLSHLQEVDVEEFLMELEGYPEYEFLSDTLINYLDGIYSSVGDEVTVEDIQDLLLTYACFAERIRCFMAGEHFPEQYNRAVYSYSTVLDVFNSFLDDLEKLGMHRDALQKGGLRVVLYFLLVRQYEGECEVSLLFTDVNFCEKKTDNFPEIQYLEQELAYITRVHCDGDISYKDITALYEEGIEPGEVAELRIRSGTHLYVFSVSFGEIQIRDSEYLITNMYNKLAGGKNYG